MKTLIGLLLLIGCTSISRNPDNQDEIYGVQASRIIPNYGTGTKLLGYDTALSYVYFRGDSTIYDFPYTHYQYEDDTLRYVETRHRFVMAQRDSTFGIEFNRHLMPQKKRALLDSVFKNEWITTGEVIAGDAMLVSSQKDQKSGTLVETYKVTPKNDTNYIGTCELLFTDSMPWLQLRYNEQINKEKKMQLVKTTFHAASQFYKPFNGVLDGYTATFEFTEIPVSKEQWEKLLAYFQ